MNFSCSLRTRGPKSIILAMRADWRLEGAVRLAKQRTMADAKKVSFGEVSVSGGDGSEEYAAKAAQAAVLDALPYDVDKVGSCRLSAEHLLSQHRTVWLSKTPLSWMWHH